MWGGTTEGGKPNYFEGERIVTCENHLFSVFWYPTSHVLLYSMMLRINLCKLPLAGNLFFYYPVQISVVENFEIQLMEDWEVITEWEISNHKDSESTNCYAIRGLSFSILTMAINSLLLQDTGNSLCAKMSNWTKEVPVSETRDLVKCLWEKDGKQED